MLIDKHERGTTIELSDGRVITIGAGVGVDHVDANPKKRR